MAVQPPCKRRARVRFLHRASVRSALVHQLRRLPLTQPNFKSAGARFQLAGCSRRGRVLEAREVGAKPTPAAIARPIDHQLSCRPLKPENPGQHWMGRPFRGSGPIGRGNTLKPCPVWVRVPGAAPTRVSQFGRGNGPRSRQVRVRVPLRAPDARSPIGRRHDAQTVGSVGSNPSARANPKERSG